MSAGAHDEVTLRRYADAQAKLEHAGGWGGATTRRRRSVASGSRRTTSTGRSARSPDAAHSLAVLAGRA